MLDLRRRLSIDRLGARAEGLARVDRGFVGVPYALPGEEVLAEVDGERVTLVSVEVPSAERVPAFCPYYEVCGGCAIQTLDWAPYAAWKRGLLTFALERAGVTTDVAPLVDGHGAGRRRATFHARTHFDALERTRTQVGFMRARAHEIIDIEQCPILAPDMAEAVSAAQGVAQALAQTGKPLDILVTAAQGGLDIDVRGTGPLAEAPTQALVRLAERRDFARISNHGEIVIARRTPELVVGRTRVALPPGSFLQATEAGEEVLASLVQAAVGKAKRVADCFAGIGTFALRMAEGAEVHAVEQDPLALEALSRAAHHAPGLRGVTTERRDLVRRPLAGGELSGFDALVFDPPRAGAQAQAEALAASKVPVVVAVSCNVQTFVRDAAILVAGGYVAERVTPVDQFKYSPHLEIVGVFRRPAVSAGKGRGRRLLG